MKKRPKQHEIGDDGVTLFQEALRKANKNSKLTATFNEQIKNETVSCSFLKTEDIPVMYLRYK